MRKLALSDEILLSVDKPARYLGNEINAVYKNIQEDGIRIRFAMCFPDVYEIGMSHLGIQILYDMFNRRADTWCERVYSPWVDLDARMRAEGIPLFALESQDPIRDFDFLGITLQYEMCYTNVLQILDLSGIPLLARDRGDDVPLVIGGGPCTYNPEPLADFFDLFYIGEGETVYDELLDLYKEMKAQWKGDSGRGSATVGERNAAWKRDPEGQTGFRKAFLRRAAKIPGIYVPSLYTVTYHEDGTIAAFAPNEPDVPAVIKKQIVMDLDGAPYPEKPLIPYIQVTQDRVTLEVQRGCIRGCRFCQAGMIYRPTREKSVERLKESAMKMLSSTGHEEISLSSLSTSDYTKLPELLDFLIDTCRDKHINISLPSLRIDSFSLDVMSRVQDVKKSSLTFAPEAGSQRMRDVINKGLTEEIILKGAAEAFRGGWSKVKLYFMLGLPSETEEDRKAIARLANEVAVTYYDELPREKRLGRCQITVSTSFFVPKPFTPLQWARMFTPEEYSSFAYTVNDEMHRMLNERSIKYNWHQADETVLEGVFARGDRRLGSVIEKAYRAGALFDAWTEFWNYDRWVRAFEEAGVDMDFYTLRKRSEDEIFPWDFIDAGVTKAFLLREWHRAMEAKVTPNCRAGCSGCGAKVFGGGVWFEKRDAKQG